MFDYTPMSEEAAQQARYRLLDDGEYEAVIEKATHKVSSKGNNMLELEITAFDRNNVPVRLKDYLIFTDSMSWKIRHCCDSVDLLKEYEEQKFTPELLVGKATRILVSSQKGQIIPVEKLNGKPPGSVYPDKNVIYDYVKKENQKPLVAGFKDDLDVPF